MTRHRHAGRWRRLWLASLLGPTLLGCAQDAKLSACNIAVRGCQEDIYYAVLRLRGDGWDPFSGLPPIRTISLAQYRSELESTKAASAPAPAAADPAQDPFGTALQILGLITKATSVAQASVDSQVDNVAAFYAPATRKVTVIDRGQARDDVADTILLAHELVHAFQDRELGSRGFDSGTDGSFASRSYIEGEAVLYERLVAHELAPRPWDPTAFRGYYSSWLTGLRRSMPQQASPFFAAPWFVYPLGGGLLADRYLEGGNAAVRRVAAAFPTHSLDYMVESTPDATPEQGSRAVDCPGTRTVGPFSLVAADRFGAIQFYAFLVRTGIDEASAWELALAWRDDRIEVYFDQDSERTLVVWRLRFADADRARAIAQQIPEARDAMLAPLVIHTRDDGEVSIAGSDEPDVAMGPDAALNCP